MQKPSIPKGTRDFSPLEMSRRNFLFDTIKSVFRRYGFQAIETPAMENLSTLLGKYGDEGDKLLFKVLNSGNFMEKVSPEYLDDSKKLVGQISEKGLRYDLTVPFARFVVQHQNELNFPFKRYQIQPVWRADRPQKGRYREFYQCDVDIIGSNSLLNELELIQIIDDVFRALKVNVTLKLNNRKILAGIAEIINAPNQIIDITTAIDKIEKIGLEAVNSELRDRGISDEGISALQPILTLSGSNEEKLAILETLFANVEIGKKGIEEIRTVLNFTKALTELNLPIELDLTLARGLNYYTGLIFEVKAADVKIGSICGGGRYDNLTGIFGLQNISGVGISFGADRIYDVMLQLEAFPQTTADSTEIMFVNFGSSEAVYALPLVAELRKNGINAELYPDSAKPKKQMSYADAKGIPFVALIGENEIKNKTITVKNMLNGEQSTLNSVDELIFFIKK